MHAAPAGMVLMSYCLDLYFEPPVQHTRMLRYFAARKHYAIAENHASYENTDTGVYFSVKLLCARDVSFRKSVVSAHFEINYNRPSFFGIEAERELSDLVATFRPRIEDSQIHGMAAGPYSGEGFLNGWNFGNLFSVRNRLSNDPNGNIPSIAADELRAAWTWNYRRAERNRLNIRCFVPRIMFSVIKEHPRRVIVWAQGTPVLLPKVDYVLVGRIARGEKRYGLASWSELLEIVQRAGFDTTRNPITLDYAAMPPSIAHWTENIPLIDPAALSRAHIEAYQIVDDELVEAARESIERDQGDLSIMRIPTNSKDNGARRP
jgi:hypothetical protein